MGKRKDGRAITPYAGSWAQIQAARTRPQYNIRLTYVDGKRKWKADRQHADGAVTHLDVFDSRKQAETTIRLLAGPGGDVTILDYI